MEHFQNLLNRIFDERLVLLTLSNKQKAEQLHQKAVLRLFLKKGVEVYQLELFTKTQAFHENLGKEQALERIAQLFETEFKQLNGKTIRSEFQVKRSKKGKLLSSFKAQAAVVELAETHNTKKKYLLEEGIPVPALVELGVMSPEGRVKKEHYSKFKQINKFIELIDHSLKEDNRPLNIVDFGCGKSYLTFVMYHYFTEIKKQKVSITGLDLKRDVIENCQKIAQKYGYDGLTFQVGDIAEYKTTQKVDMVVTLHACDTATDIAMFHAVKWGVDYLFSVPCCQHELNAQIESEQLKCITDYGLLKERFGAIATDGVRATLLESVGYKVDVVEFVDFSHSPKNLLLRCKKSKVDKEKMKVKREQAKSFLELLHSKQTLLTLLEEHNL